MTILKYKQDCPALVKKKTSTSMVNPSGVECNNRITSSRFNKMEGTRVMTNELFIFNEIQLTMKFVFIDPSLYSLCNLKDNN
jgi:hypothetical protein